MTKECPACGYKRTPEDTAPDWQCPNCERAYNKIAVTPKPPPKPKARPQLSKSPAIRVLRALLSVAAGVITSSLILTFLTISTDSFGWGTLFIGIIAAAFAYLTYLLWPAGLRISWFRGKEQYCTHCGSVGRPKMVTPGSLPVELIIWLIGILLALFTFTVSIWLALGYSVWRHLARKSNACRSCGATAMIPVDSPRAVKEIGNLDTSEGA